MRILTLLTLVFCACIPALHAQSVSGLGAISGIVTDASGSTVPDAVVTVSNDRLGLRREMATTSGGIFNALSLTPGADYRVSVRKAGFSDFEVTGIEVRVGQVYTVRAGLQVAQSAQTVEVTAQVLVDETKTGVSDVVNSNQIMNLPINGRRVDSFVLLTPGVAPEGNFGLLTFRGIPGGNAFLTDGNDTTNQLWNENAGRTRIASNISQDAVQEFQVLSNNYSAEFGRAVGGVVNTVTRSGGNEVHGTAFWFYRDQNFNANDRYAKRIGQDRPEEKRNQFGGSAGGPIVRDRLFYFANTELTRRNFPIVSSLARAPLTNAQGEFIGQCDASPAQCQAAIRSLDRFNTVLERRADNTLGFAKLDFRPNDRNSLSLSFNLLNWESPNGIQTGAVLNNGAALGSNGVSTVRTRYGRAAWTAVMKPNLVNEFRFGWMKDRLHDYINSELLPPTGIATITVQGVANLGGANYLPRIFPTEDRYQFANNLSWTGGRHLVKLGFDFSHTRDVQEQVFTGNGAYVYATFTNFALDFSGNTSGEKRWQSYQQGFGPPLVDTWIRDYMVYLQDQWRVTNTLTLNLGIRVETPQYKQPTIFNPDYPETGLIPQGGVNHAPRFGFAWNPSSGKTVIRGGYGIFFARTPGGTINWLHRDNSVFQYTLFLQGNNAADRALGPVFPNQIPAPDRRPPAGSTSLTIAGRDWRVPYTQQADFGIERQIMRDTVLTASYIWSRGIAFTSVRDSNMGMPTQEVTYRILDAAGNQTGTFSTLGYLSANRVDRRYQRIGILENGGQSWYNALAVQLRKRQSRYFESHLSYTWSHALDTNLGVTGDNLFFGNVPRSFMNGDFRNEKATSENDQRHRLVLNFISDLKFGLKGNWFAANIIDNWQLSGIYNYSSGNYLTPTVFVSGTPFTGAAFNNSLNGLGGSNRVPFLRRTSVPVSSVNRMDARLSKVLDVTERYRLMFMFEAFNITNSQYDTSVIAQAYQLSGGAFRPNAQFGEGTQSAGFPDGTNARRAQVSLRFIF